MIDFLPTKFSVKGMDVAEIELAYVENRREEFERDWQRNLLYLLPPSAEATFEEAWSTLFTCLRRIVDLLR